MNTIKMLLFDGIIALGVSIIILRIRTWMDIYAMKFGLGFIKFIDILWKPIIWVMYIILKINMSLARFVNFKINIKNVKLSAKIFKIQIRISMAITDTVLECKKMQIKYRGKLLKLTKEISDALVV